MKRKTRTGDNSFAENISVIGVLLGGKWLLGQLTPGRLRDGRVISPTLRHNDFSIIKRGPRSNTVIYMQRGDVLLDDAGNTVQSSSSLAKAAQWWCRTLLSFS